MVSIIAFHTSLPISKSLVEQEDPTAASHQSPLQSGPRRRIRPEKILLQLAFKKKEKVEEALQFRRRSLGNQQFGKQPDVVGNRNKTPARSSA